MKELLHHMDNTIGEIIHNHPHAKIQHLLVKRMKLGKAKPITDADRTFMAKQLSEPSKLRTLFSNNIAYGSDNIMLINESLEKFINNEDSEDLDKIRKTIIAVDTYD